MCINVGLLWYISIYSDHWMLTKRAEQLFFRMYHCHFVHHKCKLQQYIQLAITNQIRRVLWNKETSSIVFFKDSNPMLQYLGYHPIILMIRHVSNWFFRLLLFYTIYLNSSPITFCNYNNDCEMFTQYSENDNGFSVYKQENDLWLMTSS